MIIKATGKMCEILIVLKTLSETFGQDATLTEIKRTTRLSRLETAERKQFEGKKS